MIEIRKVRENELDHLIVLCELHAVYEKAEYSKEGKKEALHHSLFSSSPDLFCLVAVDGETILGYTTYMFQYSTWDASFYTYLDCIFMIEEARGKSIGKQLMNQVAEESQKKSISLIQWHTPDFNVDAIRFYKRIGATSKSKERFFWEL